MRAKQLVPILADLLGLEVETANLIDRTLAQAGFRQRNQGRSWPEVTRGEALHLLLGFMSAQRVATVTEDVRKWTGAIGQLEQLAPVAQAKYRAELEQVLGPFQAKDKSVNLVDYLLALCDLIEREVVEGQNVRFEIIRSHGTAHVTFANDSGEVVARDLFMAEGFANRTRHDSQIHTTAWIYGHALREITKRTPSPDLGSTLREYKAPQHQ